MNTSRFHSREEYHQWLQDQGRRPGGTESNAYLLHAGLRLPAFEAWGSRSAEPRNVAAYRLIQQHYPGFRWGYDADGNLQLFGYPTINGVTPSLADLVENIRRIGEGKEALLELDRLPSKATRRLLPVIHSCDGAGLALADFIHQQCELPRYEVSQAVSQWLQRAARGVPSTVLTIVCPDYAVDEAGRYTFDRLNDGVGLVAQRAVNLLPQLWSIAQKSGWDLNVVVAIADDEADDPKIVSGVNETREAFLAKLIRSQNALRAALPAEMRLETPFSTKVNPSVWQDALTEAEAKAAASQFFGPLSDKVDLERILCARRPLYQRWYGDDVNVRATFAHQAISYMASGKLVQALPNCLFIGFDAPVMATCMHALSRVPLPILSARAVDY